MTPFFILGVKAAISYLCFIRPRYKIRGAPMGQCRVDIYYTLVLFYPRCTAWWLFKPFISSSMAKTSRKRFFRLGFRSHMVWRPGLAQSFLYFRCILIGQRWLYPTCVSSDPDIKSCRGAPMGRCRVDIYYTLVLFYHRCTVFWLF